MTSNTAVPRPRFACTPVALALVLLSGCGGSSSTPTKPPSPPPSNPFASVVFIGDSLTAGFENGSLLDTQQPNGYASLVAQQAKFSITLPLIAPPGLPGVLKLISAGFPPDIEQTSGISTGRDNPSEQPTDLAVPGHKLHDLINAAPTALPTTSEDIITNFVLGFPLGNTNTQLQEAVALKPSTIFVWAGSDDALKADGSGMPSTVTPLNTFTSDFTQLMTTLKTKTSANLIVANIPDVTAIPYMTPATTVINEVASMTGLPATVVGAALGIASGDLINAHGLLDLQTEEKTILGGGAPTPLPDSDVLTAAEVLTVQSAVNSYNQVIEQQATAAGATVVDMHAYFATLAAGITINGYKTTDAFLGGLFGLDGIHPTNTGYALLANQFIAALNTKFGLSIAPVNVDQVAAADPYFGPNVKPAGMVGIPVGAALQADQMITGWKKR